ncbi:2-oxoacid:acceptor oxidoreductase family protein [Actinomyces sp.]|uniref:2-oxoacid:acceptor oxidoreductase family protein n=1 Tax=Actinomyces sp. TaxID=29317 RepID=UPI0026DA887C|nr:2-oxoacid:acceptor oxidoreductase family protein [Actinomyces sp.]MDO4899945.1 2-oxoacid:acceptor oxidoreductase family protein [Actinomyces sp.]
MFQIRIHGRGGQGVVTAADLLAYAAFKEERHAQAFPSFGSERTGAPVVSYCRIDTRPIRTHEPVLTPDAVIVQDPTLLGAIDVFGGLRTGGYALINSSRRFATFDLDPDTVAAVPPAHRLTVPATDLAMEHLGRPLPNAVLLGAFTAVTDVLGIESVCAAIADRFPGTVGERNIAAARAAHRIVADKLARKLSGADPRAGYNHEEETGAA